MAVDADDPWEPPRTNALPQATETERVTQLRLRVVGGPQAGVTFLTTAERTVIGTHPSANLRLEDPTLSRFHCELAVQEGRVTVRDLDSTNGTIVDGVQVLSAYLREGATLALGETRIRVEVGGESVAVPSSTRSSFGRMVGRSPPMRRVFGALEKAAKTDSTVLLLGETGTGKDVAAESLHRESSRASGPFVVLDCGAIPPGLLESELFGHERGAFTGAVDTREGAFQAASGGTLFLDEIGEMPLDLQPKLLRAVESREVQRIGGRARIPVDVRVISATNRNLHRDVNEKHFRSDLYYRLAVLQVTLPPLRDHAEDVPLLVEEILARLGASESPAAVLLRSPEVQASLRRHAWPGNVRELRNYVERCVAFEGEAGLEAETGREPPPSRALSIDIDQPLKQERERWVRAFEARYLEEILKRHGGKVAPAARAAGMDRIHFYRLLSRARLR
jgi:DNA-binding NtrC family response regulator